MRHFLALIMSVGVSVATAGTTSVNAENGVRAFSQAALTITQPASPESS